MLSGGAGRPGCAGRLVTPLQRRHPGRQSEHQLARRTGRGLAGLWRQSGADGSCGQTACALGTQARTPLGACAHGWTHLRSAQSFHRGADRARQSGDQGFRLLPPGSPRGATASGSLLLDALAGGHGAVQRRWQAAGVGRRLAATGRAAERTACAGGSPSLASDALTHAARAQRGGRSTTP
jgi:hypothetical protein